MRERIDSLQAPIPADPMPPDFKVEGGPAWRIWGLAMAADGTPVAGARIVFSFPNARGSRLFFPAALTDEEGRYSSSLDVPLASPHEGMVLVKGRAEGEGFLPEEEHLTLPCPDQEEKLHRLDFVLQAGRSLKGYVLDGYGNPVDDATVCGMNRDGEVEFICLSNVDGFYSQRTEHRFAGPCLLYAAKPGVGVSPGIPVEINDQGDTRAPYLALQPLGVIEGVVKTPHGWALGGLYIEAYPIEFLHAPRDALSAHARKIENRYTRFLDLRTGEDWAGFTYGQAVTDPNGCFRILGLKPGRYFVMVTDFTFLYEDSDLDTPRTPCATGDGSVYVEAPFYRLRITLRDEQGGMIEKARLHVVSDDFSSHLNVSGGTIATDIRSGQVSIKAWASGGLYGERSLFISQEDYGTETEVMLTPSRPRGTIMISFRSYRGEAQGNLDDWHVTFAGRMEETRVETLSSLERMKSGEFILTVWEDVYNITLWPDPDTMFMPSSKWGVKAEEGKAAPVSFYLIEGGRLKFTLIPPVVKKRYPVDEVLLYRLSSGHQNLIGTIYLANMTPRLKYWRRCYHDSVASDVMHQGRYKVKARFKDFKAAEADFTIQPGWITDVVLRLD